MLPKYGFDEIIVDGEGYQVQPSFRNIAKIDDVEESYKIIHFDHHSVYKYFEALLIVNSCLDKPLPDKFNIQMVDRGGRLKAKNPVSLQDQLTIIDIARHCMLHAVIGDIDIKSRNSNKSNSNYKFNVYEFINSAQDKRGLGRSKDEALNMSMTEYIDAMRTAYPDEFDKQDNGFTEAELALWNAEVGKAH